MKAVIIGRENSEHLSRYEIQDKYEEFSKIKKEMTLCEVVIVTRKDPSSIKELFICCPGCGDSSFTGTHKITENHYGLTVVPSLKFNCCGWHGHLENGTFKQC